MHETMTRFATRPPLGPTCGGGGFSAKARRRIRHAAALAAEMPNVGAFEVCRVVWRIHRLPHRSEGSRGEQQRQQTSLKQNARQQRSQRRALLCERAKNARRRSRLPRMLHP